MTLFTEYRSHQLKIIERPILPSGTICFTLPDIPGVDSQQTIHLIYNIGGATLLRLLWYVQEHLARGFNPSGLLWWFTLTTSTLSPPPLKNPQGILKESSRNPKRILRGTLDYVPVLDGSRQRERILQTILANCALKSSGSSEILRKASNLGDLGGISEGLLQEIFWHFAEEPHNRSWMIENDPE